MMTTKSDVIRYISECQDTDELRLLFGVIKERIGMLRRIQTFDFSIGDEVTVGATKKSLETTGRVVKINKKTIDVRVADGKVWRCSPDLLTPL